VAEAGAARLFHLVRPADWAPDDDAWRPPSLASQGFVHLSFPHQLAGTLDLHFADAGPVWLLEVDPAQVAADLRLERSRDEEPFPHLFAALPLDSLRRHWHLRGALGAPDLPRLGARPDRDDPPGIPGPPSV
jgi:uncharacterized protein (DUF952 family)